MKQETKEFIPDYWGTEHKAWTDMFEEASRVFKISREELNDVKYRVFFKMVERWAWVDRMKRQNDKEPEKFKGCFWDGEII